MITAARLEWAADGTPRSSHYDDIYHYTQGGLEQARHVFIQGNELPQRWQNRHDFTILETGFGLGLSFLATWQAWRNDPQRCDRLHFISTELHPFRREDLAILHAHWPELSELAAQLQAAWPPLISGFHHLLLDAGKVSLTLLLGDANDTLKQFVGTVDALYLDGFAPQKNPQLWSSELLSRLTRHAAPGCTLASWCVAGPVRSALRELGWAIKKKEGYAGKWHMLTASCGNGQTAPASPHDAIVIGAGIAGCSMAEALARRGWNITLLEQNSEPAQAASGNPAGLLHPMLTKDDNLAARFSRAAYLYGLRLLQRLDGNTRFWQACGILQIAEDKADATMQQACCASFPADYVSWLDRDQASAQAGLPVSAGGWWFPQAAWLNPPAFCHALLHAAGSALQTHYDCTVTRVHYAEGEWHVFGKDERLIASAEHLIFANAAAANALLPELELTLRSIRGQLSYLPHQALDGLQTALCGAGYAIRTKELSLIGASFIEEDDDPSLRAEEHASNLGKLQALLPRFSKVYINTELDGRVSFRAASHDRMPLVGTLPQTRLKEQHTLANLPRQAGLHALLGFGARGLSWAPLAAELLAAQLNKECQPLESKLIRMLDPARYQLKKARKDANL